MHDDGLTLEEAREAFKQGLLAKAVEGEECRRFLIELYPEIDVDGSIERAVRLLEEQRDRECFAIEAAYGLADIPVASGENGR